MIERTIEEQIADLEKNGFLVPECKFCQEHFYSKIKAGTSFNLIHAPKHKPSRYCESGKSPHCSCDTCF